MGLSEKLFLAIGEPIINRSLKGLLKDVGHEITVDAADIAAVLEGIPDAKKAGVRAAIVYGDPYFDGNQFEVGRAITEVIRTGLPDVRVIGLGTLTTPKFGDDNFSLGDVGFTGRILTTLKELPPVK